MILLNPSPHNHAFTFIEIMLVMLLVLLAMTGTLHELAPYLWILEVSAALVWFALSFAILRRTIWDVTIRRTIMWDIRQIVTLLFALHIAVAFLLRFYYKQDLLFSYLSPLVLLVAFPLIAYPLLRSLLIKLFQSRRLSAERIMAIASTTDAAKQFLQKYPDSRIYIYDHDRNHKVGVCLLQYRRTRDERPDLYEDVLLEIPINLKQKRVVEGKERFTHYIFQPYREGSIIMELPDDIPQIYNYSNESNSLDQQVLSHFDGIINAFPSLEKSPLPIAIRNIPFEMVT